LGSSHQSKADAKADTETLGAIAKPKPLNSVAFPSCVGFVLGAALEQLQQSRRQAIP